MLFLRHFPLILTCAALNTEAMVCERGAFFVFAFFSSFLSSLFFSPIGKCNGKIAIIQKKKVTHWPWKRWEAWLMPFQRMIFWGMPAFH